MDFTFNEWLIIREALETAKRNYEDFKDICEPSDEEFSLYQIYKRKIAVIETIINKLKGPYCRIK